MKNPAYSFIFSIALLNVLFTLAPSKVFSQSGNIYCEVDGIVSIEAESENPCSDPNNCGWLVTGDTLIDTFQLRPLNGYEGDGYIFWKPDIPDFCGPAPEYAGCGKNLSPVQFTQPITYRINFDETGVYQFIVRTWQPNIQYDDVFDGPASLNNDLWVRFNGGTPFTVKRQEDDTNDTTFAENFKPDDNGFIKMFQAKPNQWTWDNFGDAKFIGEQVYWQIDEPGNYDLQIGGRSYLFGIDKFALYNTADKGQGQAKAAPPSPVNCDDAFIWYEDKDEDGYGNPNVTGGRQEGFITEAGDCNDEDPNINPDQLEILGNGIDDNCNGEIDEIGPLTGLNLVNADNDKVIRELSDNDVISFSDLPTRNLNIVATTSGTLASIEFVLTGAQEHQAIEGGAPYSVFGDQAGDFGPWAFLEGTYTLTATAYDDFGGQGNVLNELIVNFQLQEAAVLPVELINFDAKVQNNGVLLNWATASEIDNEGFEIERSQNGESFSFIDRVPGRGNTDEFSSYQYMDTQPLFDRSFYRLKQIDINGEFTYSPTVEVSVNTPFATRLYPNPLDNTSELTIELGSASAGNVNVVLIDMLGRESFSLVHERADSRMIKLPLNGVNTGIYFIRINDGLTEETHKILVK